MRINLLQLHMLMTSSLYCEYTCPSYHINNNYRYLLFTCFIPKSSSLEKTEVETGQISYAESSAPGPMYQDPSTIEHKAAPTGDMYALPEKPARHQQQQQQKAMELPTSPQQQAMELPTYQDPNTIQRQAAATGDMYALPEKRPKQPSGPAPALYTEVEKTDQVSSLLLYSMSHFQCELESMYMYL